MHYTGNFIKLDQHCNQQTSPLSVELKDFWKINGFKPDKKVKEVVTAILKETTTVVYAECVKILIWRYDKCKNVWDVSF